MVQTVFHMDGSVRFGHCQFHTRVGKYLEFSAIRDFNCVTRFLDQIRRVNSNSIIYRSETGKAAEIIRTGTGTKKY